MLLTQGTDVVALLFKYGSINTRISIESVNLGNSDEYNLLFVVDLSKVVSGIPGLRRSGSLIFMLNSHNASVSKVLFSSSKISTLIADFDLLKEDVVVYQNSHSGLNQNDILFIDTGYSFLDPIYFELAGLSLISGNVHFDWTNNYKITYFGRISGPCSLNNLLGNSDELFGFDGSNFEFIKNSLSKFDRDLDFHQEQFKNLICLVSLPSMPEYDLIWGDFKRLEIYIMKEDLIRMSLDRIIIKLAPD